ncbi:MAG TPA: PH domain-containing protein [Hadesarchaea archaeon]|nr:PH domain-containing protein [Hadesarchaea archaeon]
MKTCKRFRPHANLKKVYYVYLGLVAIIPLVITSAPVWAVPVFAPELLPVLPLLLVPLVTVLVIMGFISFWIPKYYRSIYYMLKENEVVVERGVWWKIKQVVPYARVMTVNTIQGPISRFFGVGSAQVYTAGYTGLKGGTAGPGSRGAEASIWGVPNFVEIKDMIIELIGGKPLFGGTATSEIGSEILKELRRIRKAVEK